MNIKHVTFKELVSVMKNDPDNRLLPKVGDFVACVSGDTIYVAGLDVLEAKLLMLSGMSEDLTEEELQEFRNKHNE